MRLAPESPVELWQPGVPPQQAVEEARLQDEADTQRKARRESSVSREQSLGSQGPGCTLSPGLGVPGLLVSVQQTLLSRSKPVAEVC